MAAGRKLRNLLTKLHSISTHRRRSNRRSPPPLAGSDRSDSSISSSSDAGNLHPVYVGKSRRRYLVGSDVICHPLFQELAVDNGGAGEVAVGCEVVLFEHFLWMLGNSEFSHADAIDELVDFYTC